MWSCWNCITGAKISFTNFFVWLVHTFSLNKHPCFLSYPCSQLMTLYLNWKIFSTIFTWHRRHVYDLSSSLPSSHFWVPPSCVDKLSHWLIHTQEPLTRTVFSFSPNFSANIVLSVSAHTEITSIANIYFSWSVPFLVMSFYVIFVVVNLFKRDFCTHSLWLSF